jgi:hypothetical protein
MHPDAAFPHLRIEIKRTARDEYEIWRSELRAKQPRFAHENVRFDHDPLWRSRFLSIQSACDGNHHIHVCSVRAHGGDDGEIKCLCRERLHDVV